MIVLPVWAGSQVEDWQVHFPPFVSYAHAIVTEACSVLVDLRLCAIVALYSTLVTVVVCKLLVGRFVAVATVLDPLTQRCC